MHFMFINNNTYQKHVYIASANSLVSTVCDVEYFQCFKLMINDFNNRNLEIIFFRNVIHNSPSLIKYVYYNRLQIC